MADESTPAPADAPAEAAPVVDAPVAEAPAEEPVPEEGQLNKLIAELDPNFDPEHPDLSRYAITSDASGRVTKVDFTAGA